VIEKISPVPVHVAIIMDGNGRWAEKRGLPRTEGHKEGVKVVRKITKVSAEVGIKFLTLYAFSTENWKRSKDEVDFLFNLFVDAINSYLSELRENSVSLNFIGDIKALPYFVRRSLLYAQENTAKGDKLTLNIAINYGSRLEIINAVKQICISKGEINEETFRNYLYTKGQPDPEILIRTSGEKRLSNFLLYQASYAELFFTDTLWPDFSEEEYVTILKQFSKRERRFGGVI